MNRIKLTICALGLMTSAVAFQSCSDDDNDDLAIWQPTALVTVRPASDGSFTMQLNDTATLHPSNMSGSPFGNKEVRALVSYTDNGYSGGKHSVFINWIDSIRTKMPVPSLGANNSSAYGDAPIEIVNDWVTVAEDGYLTLRIRTLWGNTNRPHYINLISGTNTANPYEFELRHNANGDLGNNLGDALIAFNLNKINLVDTNRDIKIKINWNSFSGYKSAEFDLKLRPLSESPEPVPYSRYVK